MVSVALQFASSLFFSLLLRLFLACFELAFSSPSELLLAFLRGCIDLSYLIDYFLVDWGDFRLLYQLSTEHIYSITTKSGLNIHA